METIGAKDAVLIDDEVRFATIAWRIWHIGSLCLRGYEIHFFEDVPELGDRHEWLGTPKRDVQALAEDWEHFISRIAALGGKRLQAPIGMGPGGWPMRPV